MRHLLVGQIEETREDHEEVGLFESCKSGDTGRSRLDESTRIVTEDDQTGEAEAFCENPGKRRTCFPGPILVVTGEQDDVFALSRP